MKSIITAFKEQKSFKHNRPWDVNTMTFPTDITTPPHYADTIEVLLCCGVKGEIYIGGHCEEFYGKQVFYIPPRVVHSIFYKKNDGYVKVLKINIEQLKTAVDIENLLKYQNKNFLCFPTCVPCFDEISIISDIFKNSDDIIEICECILHIFLLLSQYCDTSEFSAIKNDSISHNLRKIIQWTENNYLRKISLEEIANLIGYEKHYFCNKFKLLTGISYVNYVNNLRIQHACNLLKGGSSVSDTCNECGYDNLSYFIQLFKKIVGVTPKTYSFEISGKIKK